MQSHTQKFIPETVDEQIEQFKETYDGQQPATKFIQDLSSIYEQTYFSADAINQSLDHIWKRLTKQLAENTTNHATDNNSMHRPHLVLLDGNVPTHAGRQAENMGFSKKETIFQTDVVLEEIPHSQPVPIKVRRRKELWRVLVVSAAVAVVLLNILGWGLLTHRVPVPSTVGKGATATATPAPPTPIPTTKEQPSRFLKHFTQEWTNCDRSHQYHDVY